MATTTDVLKCDPDSITFDDGEPDFDDPDTLSHISIASHRMKWANPVAFPTETVYGLGALALHEGAAAQIFAIKGRPTDNPLIVHVSSLRMLRSVLPADYTFSRPYDILIRRFWPGPLTLLFPADPAIVPPIITAGHPTVAVRMPAQPVARALIALVAAPLAAPSANSSGKPSPTRAEHVLRDLGGKVGTILDGGPCAVGVESTVLDGLNPDGDLRVLRPGGVTVEDIERVLREEMAPGERVPRVLVHRRDFEDAAMEAAPTTPGMKYRHYSPATPVTLLHTGPAPPAGVARIAAADLVASLRSQDAANPKKVGLLTPSDSRLLQYAKDVPGIAWYPFPLGALADPAVTAQRLFDGLISLDEQGVDLILVEEISEEREGLAVMNRVRKAASDALWVEL
ncbi:translation factor [Dentipellis sp. KUC8613]|nr:translation factor [Dentipellis sp. KUC8613]